MKSVVKALGLGEIQEWILGLMWKIVGMILFVGWNFSLRSRLRS